MVLQVAYLTFHYWTVILYYFFNDHKGFQHCPQSDFCLCYYILDLTSWFLVILDVARVVDFTCFLIYFPFCFSLTVTSLSSFLLLGSLQFVFLILCTHSNVTSPERRLFISSLQQQRETAAQPITGLPESLHFLLPT